MEQKQNFHGHDIEIVKFEPCMEPYCHDLVMMAYTETTGILCKRLTRHPLTVGLVISFLTILYKYFGANIYVILFLAFLSLPIIYWTLVNIAHTYDGGLYSLPDYKNVAGFWTPPNMLWLARARNSFGNEHFVGSVGIIHTSSDTAELVRMNLEKPFRGIGLSVKLMEHCISYCKQEGNYKQIVLYTSHVQHAAHKLYLKTGFTHEPKDNTMFRIFGVVPYITVLKFSLDLQKS